MIFRSLSVAFMAISIASFSGRADAAAIVTYSGVLSSGVDNIGIFGNKGQDLAGKTFELRFEFYMGPYNSLQDPVYLEKISGADPGYNYYNPVNFFPYSSFGFFPWAFDNNFIFPVSVFNVDGYSYYPLMRANALEEFNVATRTNSGFSVNKFVLDDTGGTNDEYSELSIIASFQGAPENFRISYPQSPVSNISGFFDFYRPLSLGPGDGMRTFGTFSGPGTFSFTAHVPEPSTWLMLISGFGLVGFSQRRRRALAAP